MTADTNVDRINKNLRDVKIAAPEPAYSMLVSGVDFMAEFKPPDYHIDGILQRGQVCALTSPPNMGKTSIAVLMAMATMCGSKFADRTVRKGRVLYLAGENCDDVRLRFQATAKAGSADVPDVWQSLTVLPQAVPLERVVTKIIDDANKRGEFSLVIVDTTAAFFSGEDENDNTAARGHAANMRELTKIAGNPCIVALSHPTKNAQPNRLEPRGGSGFLGEIDQNLTLWLEGHVMTLHHTKIRGATFEPIQFELRLVDLPQYRTADGKPITTVAAHHIDDGRADALNDAVRQHAAQLLNAMQKHPGKSLGNWTELAQLVDKNRTSYVVKQLVEAGLAEKAIGGKYELTAKGVARAKSLK